MNSAQASRTAEYMAFFRALESFRPAAKRLFADPFATRFLRPGLYWAARLSRVPLVAQVVNGYADRRLPGARTSAIARTRFIDDSLRSYFARYHAQLVILGAGFDCRAYRLPELSRVPVFEVDHPATLSAKLQQLGRALPQLPENVSYVNADFNKTTLPEVLRDSEFDPGQPALFLWEGVTNYLSEQAVDSVIRYVAGCRPGSRVVFTYVHSGMLDGSVHFEGAERLLRDVARLNEPWTFGISPEGLQSFLSERGLSLLDDIPAAEYRKRYFGPTAGRMSGYEFYRIAVADVGNNSAAPGRGSI
jgi:methyltransferase (TIGR00027 family)